METTTKTTPDSTLLDAKISTSQSINSTIDEFVSNDTLKGEAWDSVRKKLASYSSILTAYNTHSQEFANSISNAINKINTIIDEYTGTKPLTKIDNFATTISNNEKRLKEIETETKTLNSSLYKVEKRKVDYDEENKKPIFGDVKVEDPAVRKKLEELEKERQELVVYQTTINKLKVAYDNAKKEINEVYASMTSLEQEIDSITPSVVLTSNASQ